MVHGCFSFSPGDEVGWEVRQHVPVERSVGMTRVLLPDLLCSLVQASSPLFASVSPPEEDIVVPIYLTGCCEGIRVKFCTHGDSPPHDKECKVEVIELWNSGRRIVARVSGL